MPKSTPSRTTKTIEFEFDGRSCRATIESTDSEDKIYQAFRKAVGAPSGSIVILDKHGHKHKLKYQELKTGKVFVAAANRPSQGPSTGSLANFKSAGLVSKMLANWELGAPEELLPADMAPRGFNALGEKASAGDIAREGIEALPPAEWPKSFVVELFKLSKQFPKRSGHKEALKVLDGVRSHRRQVKGGENWEVVEVLAADIRKVVAGKIEWLEEMAGETLDVVTYAGGLWGGIESAEKEIEEEEEARKTFAGGLRKGIESAEKEMMEEEEAREVTGHMKNLGM